jgi:hypothetical protein
VAEKGAVEMRIAIANLSVLVLLSSVAFAGDLASDPNALYYDDTTWCGTAVMEEGNLKATIDYCVYGPGQFSYPGQGYTPTSGEFVYAYQVFGEGTTEIITFGVGLDVSSAANNIGTWTMSGGVEPNEEKFQGSPPDSAIWKWVPGIQQGFKSVGLAFSSPHAPMWYVGDIENGGSGAAGELPSPSDVIPEPVTLSLLLAGAVVGGWRRHGR